LSVSLLVNFVYSKSMSLNKSLVLLSNLVY